jgi:hypothetical protein
VIPPRAGRLRPIDPDRRNRDHSPTTTSDNDLPLILRRRYGGPTPCIADDRHLDRWRFTGNNEA